jgi:hypothetical protein
VFNTSHATRSLFRLLGIIDEAPRETESVPAAQSANALMLEPEAPPAISTTEPQTLSERLHEVMAALDAGEKLRDELLAKRTIRKSD